VPSAVFLLIMKSVLQSLIVVSLFVAAGFAQQTSSLSADDAESLGLSFSVATGWRQGSADPYTASYTGNGAPIYFYTELYSASPAGAFDTDTTEEVLRSKWGDAALSARLHNISAASAEAVEAEWPGSRMERWFRVSNDRFLVERCMTNGVSASIWTAVAKPACEAQYNAVVVTASTLPPTYRAAEPAPKPVAVQLARIPGGHCATPSGASETAKMTSLVTHGERADTPANQFACWEEASQLGSADAMTKIGQLFLERDQVHPNEQDRTAGVVWLLVAADRYTALMRTTPAAESKARYRQRFNTIMDLVGALKSEKLTTQQFDAAVTEASNWKKSNMHLFR
jgi:hypothetical protein